MRVADGLINSSTGQVEAMCEPLTGLHLRCFRYAPPINKPFVISNLLNESNDLEISQYSRVIKLADQSAIQRLKALILGVKPGAIFADGIWYEVLED